MSSHLRLVGGTATIAPEPEPAVGSKPAWHETFNLPPVYTPLIAVTPHLIPVDATAQVKARAAILGARLEDGRTVREVLDTMRHPDCSANDYTDGLCALRPHGIFAVCPQSPSTKTFAVVEDPKLMLRKLNLRKQLKPADVEGLLLLNECLPMNLDDYELE